MKNRHNVGFLFVEYLLSMLGAPELKLKKKFNSEMSQIDDILLVKPLSYMNRSGENLLTLRNYYNLTDEDFLVCYDDVDLKFGDLRYKDTGSGGSHNGMKSVVSHMSQEVSRLRFGVDSEFRKGDLSDFVLSDFSKEEWQAMGEVFKKAFSEIENQWLK